MRLFDAADRGAGFGDDGDGLNFCGAAMVLKLLVLVIVMVIG